MRPAGPLRSPCNKAMTSSRIYNQESPSPRRFIMRRHILQGGVPLQSDFIPFVFLICLGNSSPTHWTSHRQFNVHRTQSRNLQKVDTDELFSSAKKRDNFHGDSSLLPLLPMRTSLSLNSRTKWSHRWSCLPYYTLLSLITSHKHTHTKTSNVPHACLPPLHLLVYLLVLIKTIDACWLKWLLITNQYCWN